MNELAILSSYEAILSESRKLLALAKAGDWDKLVEIEQDRNQLLQALKNSKATVLLDAELEARRLELVRLILIEDEETQKLSQLWMSELEGIIGSLSVEKKLNQAYDYR